MNQDATYLLLQYIRSLRTDIPSLTLAVRDT